MKSSRRLDRALRILRRQWREARYHADFERERRAAIQGEIDESKRRK